MISSDTLVTYPDGQTRGSSPVVHVERLDEGRWAVVLAETPAHPVDPTWPDQGPDRGALIAESGRHELLDCRIGAWGDGELHVGDSLPARLGTPGWNFVVVHVLADASAIAVGEQVAVEVDEEHRLELSRGHTACHLASLALNSVLTEFWSKPVRTDSIGNPDFDQAAIQRSVIRPSGSTDVYRLGKSLRRSGFDAARLRAELPVVSEEIGRRLAELVSSGSNVRIEREDALLGTRRFWRCLLAGTDASLPCGGTHVAHTAGLGLMTVSLTLNAEGTTLTMETDVAPVQPRLRL